jgi:predicted transcriptional regulator
MQKQYHRPRDEARQLIIDALVNNPEGLTRTQIAKALMRSKTPHLIKLTEDLVDEGILLKQLKIFNNGVEGYIYLWIAP